MKLLFIDRYFYPDLQATSCILTDLTTHVAGKHKVTVVCGYPSSFSKKKIKRRFFSDREIYDSIEIIRVWSPDLPRRNVIFRWINYVGFIVNAFLMALFLRRWDLTVVMTSPPLVGITAYILSKIRSIPYLFICQDIVPESAIGVGMIGRGFLAHCLDVLNVLVMENSTRIVSVGERMRDMLIAKGIAGDRIDVIPNWTNVGIIKQMPKDNPFSRRYGIHDKFVVMYAGNIGLSYNLEDVVYAAEYLREVKDVVFVVVGDGSNKVNIVSLACKIKAANIVFLPFQGEELMSSVLASADVSVVMLRKGLSGYVIPSKIYGILTSGRAVVGVVEEDSEIARLIKEADCGVVVSPGKPKLLSDAITSLHENRDLLNIYASNALNYAREKDFMHTSLEKYDALFNSLTALIAPQS